MKDIPWGVKFDIPSITLESDSGSCRSSKKTPCRKEGSLDTHLSPTFSGLPKSPAQQISNAKPWTRSSPNTDTACENHLCRASLFHQSKAASSISIATKVRAPASHNSEGTPLEVLPKGNAAASATQHSNTDHVKGRDLQKQVKGPADGASSRQKLQPVARLGSQPKTKHKSAGEQELFVAPRDCSFKTAGSQGSGCRRNVP
ncbi:uncharacterized protein LOC126641034 [Myiozetetes cayanensis]|uniref:uncharacterized protein LOC126641034 n=1 Tax=Myiozetetes cayanensis TaxID=478635 RepID=UPI00215E5D21|nr:uncharacterized protein LOC126641034 [Myiozetetes cayanensis]